MISSLSSKPIASSANCNPAVAEEVQPNLSMAVEVAKHLFKSRDTWASRQPTALDAPYDLGYGIIADGWLGKRKERSFTHDVLLTM